MKYHQFNIYCKRKYWGSRILWYLRFGFAIPKCKWCINANNRLDQHCTIHYGTTLSLSGILIPLKRNVCMGQFLLQGTQGRSSAHLEWLAAWQLTLSTSPQQLLEIKCNKSPQKFGRWNVWTVLASDLLPGTSDGAAEVLHYLSCRSPDEYLFFIHGVTLTGTGIRLFWVIATGHDKR